MAWFLCPFANNPQPEESYQTVDQEDGETKFEI